MVLLTLEAIFNQENVEVVLLWVAGLLIVFDIYLYFDKVDGNTISNILHRWVYNNKFFFIPYLWGVLAGHFFLGTIKSPFGNDKASNLYSLAIVIGLAIIIWIITFILKRQGVLNEKSKKRPYIQATLLVFGAVIGHFFWSIKYFEIQ